MPIYRYIDNFSPNDTYRLVRDLDPLDSGAALTDAWFTVKENITDNDSMAKVNMHITVIGTNDGFINNYADATSQLTFTFTTSGQNNLLSQKTYFYDINIKASSGETYTVEEGKLFTTFIVRQLVV